MSRHTDREVAAMYGKSLDYVQRQTREGRWPHLKVGRSIRFTDEHLAQIDAMLSVAPAPDVEADRSWGRKTRRSA